MTFSKPIKTGDQLAEIQAKTLFIASDHAGFEIKSKLVKEAESMGLKIFDLGPHSREKVDYPDFADRLCKKVIDEKESFGVLVCGSGQGMVMRANKYSPIRAALCWNEESAKLAREHNQANVLCLGARLVTTASIVKIFKVFLSTGAEKDLRHQIRVGKISSPIL